MSNWPFEYSFAPNTPQRGHFYCSPKSPRRAKRSHCLWRVVYSVTTEKVYKFTAKASHVTNCRDIAPKPNTFYGRVEVHLVNQLTKDEEESIKNQALTRATVPTDLSCS